MTARAWRVPALILAALLVVVAAVAVVEHARTEASVARQAQVRLEHIRVVGNELDALMWRSLLSPGQRTPSAADYAAGYAAYADITATIAALRRLGLARERIAEIEAPLNDVYARAIDLVRLAEEDPGASRIVATDSFSPKIDELNDRLAAIAERQGAQATAADRRVRVALYSAVIIGLSLLGLLAFRLHRIRRSAFAEAQARTAERRLRALVRHSSDVVIVVDTDAHVTFIGESVERMLGYDPSALVGTRLTDVVYSADAPQAEEALRRLCAAPDGIGTMSLRVRDAAGAYRDVEVIAENHLDDPDVGGVLMNLRDVTERRALERQLRHQAFHDGLTGLANRELFEDRLTHALVRMRRHGDRPAVVFIDLDDFKTVNDSLGHAIGDELLRTASTRIGSALRAQDTAARFGGDEFAVLLEDLDGDDATEIAERIRRALSAPVELGERRIAPSASFGIAFPDDTTTANELLGNADVAMYAAKERGKGQVVAFEPAMRERVVERLDLTGDLVVAIERNELLLEYQPVVALDSGEITGVEALVRWEHPERGRLGPDRFIGLAEQTGLIVPLGRWVLGTACAQLQAWDRAGEARLGLSVNVSTRQLADPHFPDDVKALVDAYGIDPDRVTLEITENVLVHDSEAMQRQLGAVKAIGVRLAVDDFGTGYSALSYLQSFPIDVLKVDRSFVAGIDRDVERARLVQGIVEMGHNLSLTVVAEGIEEAGEAALLRDFRSTHGQGYLFSRPVAADAILGLLDARVLSV